jgi:HAD superfamily hydrolase (TIGR01509 family)
MAFVFDVDGTLIDSNEAHTEAWVLALTEIGINKSYDEVRKLIGMGGDNLLPKLTGIEEDSPRGKKLSERRGEIFRNNFLPNLKPFPFTKDLLSYLKGKGLPMTIATSASKKDLQGLLKQAGIEEFFSQKVSSDDAAKSKPDPDIILAAVKKLKVEKKKTVMVGDTPYDIEAARKAGIPCIAFRCGGYWKDQDFKNALSIYDGPQDLLGDLMRVDLTLFN